MDKRFHGCPTFMPVLTKPTGCAFRPLNKSLGLPRSDHQAPLFGRYIRPYH